MPLQNIKKEDSTVPAEDIHPSSPPPDFYTPPMPESEPEPQETEPTQDNDNQDIPAQDEPQDNQDSQDSLTVESLAAEFGWRPDGEYDAATYLRNERKINNHLKRRIDSQGEMIANLHKMVKESTVKQAESNYEAQEAELKARKKAAMEESDWDLVDKIDDQIYELKEKKRSIPPPDTEDIRTEENQRIFQDWITDNQWYNTEEDLKYIADGIFNQYADKKPLPDILDMIDERVARYRTPPKVPKPPVPKTPSVMRGERPNQSKQRRKTYNDLTADDKQIVDNMIAAGAFADKGNTIAQRRQAYVDEMVKSGVV